MSEIKYWWLSFANPDLPEERQFLGVTILQADTFLDALKMSHRLNINPGGEVSGCQVNWVLAGKVGKENLNKLLSKQEIIELGVV